MLFKEARKNNFLLTAVAGVNLFSSRLFYGKYSCMTSILRVIDVDGNERHCRVYSSRFHPLLREEFPTVMKCKIKLRLK